MKTLSNPRITTPFYVGIDGEGKGREVHNYIMMAACDESGNHRWYTPEVPEGLSTRTCIEFILAIPDYARIFSYGFNYDITKMLVDLPNKSIYQLFRPEERMVTHDGVTVAKSVRWDEYEFNLQGTKFTIRKGKKYRVIWDVLKFYQSTFVNALKAWKVGDKEILDKIEKMKNKRSEFDKHDREEILDYCLLECRYLAQLVNKLVKAHKDAGLDLKKFHGAGTTASLILDKMSIRERNRETPGAMRVPVSQAFFGGRFEHSVIGPIEAPIWSYDISSAYPYQCRFLPCLDHGQWELSKDRKKIDQAQAALVHYKLGNPRIELPWGPFPHRDKDGCICFPAKSGGGWVWRDEYIAGEKLFDNVRFVEAWIYQSNCDCIPFKEIPHFYIERVKIGKEGAGIVLKLGPNGTYGKLAQSIGQTPPYQCWIWAGIITSGCRGQMLDMMGLHKDLSNILAIATDGMYTRERIVTPIPKDTGTWEKDLIDEKGRHVNKPLGGWEEKETKGAVFFARPGIYFEKGLTIGVMKDIVRARGIGRGELVRYAKEFVQAWEDGKDGFTLKKQLSRFCGAKTSIHRNGDEYNRAEYYGQWVQRPITLTFDPMPKRDRVIREPGSAFATLAIRKSNRNTISGMKLLEESEPYNRALHSKTPEALEMKRAELELLEQPDADYTDYDMVS